MDFTFGDLTATLRDRDTLTERLYRQVDRAEDRTRAVLLRLMKGVEARVGSEASEDDRNVVMAELYGELSDAELDTLQSFNVALIRAMVTEWNKGEMTEDAILELPHDTFEQLAAECLKAYRSEDFSIDPDPKAPTPDSAD